ncbi:MAG: methylmalonyl-CoA epimerase [Proteobacteria bacterium]|nr:methylmalonyl-CoA epimerase [Pseudomonadota bacterium]MBU1740217.1 methylmalonyl-CoA epimerase [Pseudomonadota bacterium]
MKIKRIAHIGVAVADVDEVEKVYTDKLGLGGATRETLDWMNLEVAFVPIGQTNIELVQSTIEDGVMKKYIEKKGEGVHHIALEVDDVAAATEELKARGVRMVHDTPQKGAHGALINFLHPKETHGVFIELCQYPEGDH